MPQLQPPRGALHPLVVLQLAWGTGPCGDTAAAPQPCLAPPGAALGSFRGLGTSGARTVKGDAWGCTGQQELVRGCLLAQGSCKQVAQLLRRFLLLGSSSPLASGSWQHSSAHGSCPALPQEPEGDHPAAPRPRGRPEHPKLGQRSADPHGSSWEGRGPGTSPGKLRACPGRAV